MHGFPDRRAACNGHALVVDCAGAPDGDLIAGALRCIGLLSVDRLSLPGTEGWPGEGRWTLAVLTPGAARCIGPAALDWLLARCGCVHVDEVGARPGEAGIRLGLEPATCPAPEQARICPGPVADSLQHLLSGYVDPVVVGLMPIRYDDRPCGEGGGDAERSGEIPLHEGSLAWMRHDGDGGGACVASRGRLLVSRLPLLRALVDGFRVPECDAPVRAFGGVRNREALEVGLLHVWSAIAASGGLPLITREPWPEGIPHVLSLRLDYDRPVPDAQWSAFREWQRSIGLRASWYFLGTTVDPPRIAALASQGDEVGLHYRRIEVHGARDLAAVRGAVQSGGGTLVGATCHGGNFQAARDLRWLAEAGIGYSEQLGRCSWHPYHGLMPDGSWSTLPLTARHVSVDVSLTPPRADLSYMLRTLTARVRLRGHTVVMNHPDINFDETRDAVRRCTVPGTAYWTQAEAMRWWGEAHSRATSCCERSPDGASRFAQDHAAPHQPVIRIWARVDCADGASEAVAAGTHTLVARDRFGFRVAPAHGGAP